VWAQPSGDGFSPASAACVWCLQCASDKQGRDVRMLGGVGVEDDGSPPAGRMLFS
jgi:hypothetical protein